MKTKKVTKRKVSQLEGNDGEEQGVSERLKAKLLEDSEFKKYRMIVKHIEQTHDLDDLTKEVNRLHEGRKSRTLSGTSPGANTIIECEAQDGSNRSRLSKILATLTMLDENLDEAHKSIRTYITSKYDHLLPSIRAKGDRVEYLNQYLRKGVRLQTRIQTLMKVVDIYIVDIDRMGYKISNIVALLQKIMDKAATHH